MITLEDARQILSDSRLFTRVTIVDKSLVSGILDNICRIDIHIIQGFPIVNGLYASTVGWMRMSMPQTCTSSDEGVITNWLADRIVCLVQQARNRMIELMVETILDQICFDHHWETLMPADGLGYLIQPVHQPQVEPIRILPASDGSILIVNGRYHQTIPAGERMLPDCKLLNTVLGKWVKD